MTDTLRSVLMELAKSGIEDTKYGSVLVDPTNADLKGLCGKVLENGKNPEQAIRSIYDYENKNYFVWDAANATHEEMTKALGLRNYQILVDTKSAKEWQDIGYDYRKTYSWQSVNSPKKEPENKVPVQKIGKTVYWWNNLTHEEQIDYIRQHPHTKLKATVQLKHTAADHDWWNRLNREEQQAYINAHPRTKMKLSPQHAKYSSKPNTSPSKTSKPEVIKKDEDKKPEYKSLMHRIRSVAKEQGYATNKLQFFETGPNCEVNGKSFIPRAEAFFSSDNINGQKIEAGSILFYSGMLTSEFPVESIVSHEIQHQKFQRIISNYDLVSDYKDKANCTAAQIQAYKHLHHFTQDAILEKLIKLDGCSPYSTSYWLAYKKGTCDLFMTLHETLAEIAKVDTLSKMIKFDAKYAKQVSDAKKRIKIINPLWMKFYHTINTDYAALTSNVKAPRQLEAASKQQPFIMYLKGDMIPCSEEEAEYIHISYPNGKSVWAVPTTSPDDQLRKTLQEIASAPRKALKDEDGKYESMMVNYREFVENVPIAWLKKHIPAGNDLRHPENIGDMAEDIKENGLREPLIICVGKVSRTAILGEGNHRLAAIIRAGYTEVPCRVIVGREYGNDIEGTNCDKDLIPVADEYFSADAKPSAVFRSLKGLVTEVAKYKEY